MAYINSAQAKQSQEQKDLKAPFKSDVLQTTIDNKKKEKLVLYLKFQTVYKFLTGHRTHTEEVSGKIENKSK